MKKLICFILILNILTFPSYLKAKNYTFVTLEFPPLEYLGSDSKPKGVVVDLVKQIMHSLGHTVTIKVYPWTRALNMVKNGDADAIFTIYKTPEREIFLDYSNEILVSQTIAFYAKKNNNISFDGNLDLLKNKHIGVVSSISYGKIFDKIRPDLKTSTVYKLDQNFKKLLAGRIDLIISNTYVADWELQKAKLNNKIVKLPHEIEQVPSYIGFSKKCNLKLLRDQFDTEIKKLKKNKKYKKLLKF